MVDSLKQIHTLSTKIHMNKIQYHYSLSAIMTDNSFFFASSGNTENGSIITKLLQVNNQIQVTKNPT